MTRIVIDPALVVQLSQIKEPVELCDGAGRVVGAFTPAPEPAREWGRPQLPEEELLRRARSGGRPLSEILADLEKKA